MLGCDVVTDVTDNRGGVDQLPIKPWADLLRRSVYLIRQDKLSANNFIRLMKMDWLVAHVSAVALYCIATFINAKGSNMVAIRC